MSKPIYEIPVNGDESAQRINFAASPPSSSPAAPQSRPVNYGQAPPPAADSGGWPAPSEPSTPAPPSFVADNPVPPPAPPVSPSASAQDATPSFPPPQATQSFPPPPATQSSLPAGGAPSFPPPQAPSAAADPLLVPVTTKDDLRPDPDLIAMLEEVLRTHASDLHITVNAPPMLRVDGALAPGSMTAPWGRDKVWNALRSIMTDSQKETFDKDLEFDFAFTVSANARFRVNFYQQRDAIGGAFRLIPTEIKQLKDLGVPDTVAQFATLPRGLVLVTGPTGSGKSTTLAALIDLINRTRSDHIMTVEDPIEFIHPNHKSLVNQREVGNDTHSFGAALKHVLRQDPDVILIGELRDLETISVALTAAETGHLVFATLHTQDASQTIDRIIDVFPPFQQGQVRTQLAATLQGVVCQTLVKRASGKGRAVATEILVATPAVANLIREGKTYQIPTAMQAGRALGMQTMDQHLADLVNVGEIGHEAALEKVHDVEGFKRLVHRAAPTAAAAGQEFAHDFRTD